MKKRFLLVFISLFTVFSFVSVGKSAEAFTGPEIHAEPLIPGNSKSEYIANNFGKYDSYIIGSSAAASFLPERLNEYFDAEFYNMFCCGADTEYDREAVSYLLKNDDVRHIFLVLGLDEAGKTENKTHFRINGENYAGYFEDYLFADSLCSFEIGTDRKYDTVFDVINPLTGTYDRRKRDAEEIGTMASYLEKNGSSFDADGSIKTLNNIDKCVENVRKIKQMCTSHGAELTVVIPPVSMQQLESYTTKTVEEYFTGLAKVTDYWNFAVSEITYDPRYFYDLANIRTSTADMVLACMFGEEDTYYPDKFGTLCTRNSKIDVGTKKRISANITANKKDVNIPVLLYHHITDAETDNQSAITQKTFERHMKLIKDNGFKAVSFDDLIEYTSKNKPLPEKAVVITFDDGYQSNYEYAFPVLKEQNMKATIFVIGTSVGKKDFYKDTNRRLTPHFGAEEARAMISSGLISIESHTYDMHQWAPFENTDKARESVIPFEGETDAEFVREIKQDIKKQNRVFLQAGIPTPKVIAYPNGKYVHMSNVAFRDMGYKVTLSTDENRVNTILPGIPDSLMCMGRMGISGYVSDEELLDYLSME